LTLRAEFIASGLKSSCVESRDAALADGVVPKAHMHAVVFFSIVTSGITTNSQVELRARRERELITIFTGSSHLYREEGRRAIN